MSISEAGPKATGPPPSEAGGSRDGGLPDGSLADAVKIAVAGILPALVRGLFAPRRWAMRLLTAVDSDRRLVAALSGVRDKRGGQGVRLLGGRLVVLWGVDAIREVLDRSAEVYASDSGAKGKGMSHFQPDALTLSREEDWRDRRAFNESVLATSERVHPFGARFLAVVADEVNRLDLDGKLGYEQWERMFDHITLRVVFGDRAREDQELTDLLEQLMGEANRIVAGGPTDEYHEFYGRLEWRVADPEPGSLIARFADAPQSDRTRVVQQIPHWIFATRDTLGANAYRALAVIAADPTVERRVRRELDGADLSDPSAIDGMSYLEGCLEEAMRLWPTTPLLARETMCDTNLAGIELEEGTQVMILNPFNHRDPETVTNADRLDPERWADGQRDYRFNHLSNGSQDCPGGPLVLLLGKAVLARVLERYDLTLEHPRIDPADPLPNMLDFFSTRFSASPAG